MRRRGARGDPERSARGSLHAGAASFASTPARTTAAPAPARALPARELRARGRRGGGVPGGPLDPDARARRGAGGAHCPDVSRSVARDPLTIFDGAHNPAAALALRRRSRTSSAGRPVDRRHVGARRQGRGRRCSSTLLPLLRAGRLHALEPPARAAARDAREPRAPARRPAGARSSPSPRAALERARELAGADGAVLVTGSIYLLSDLARDGAPRPRGERDPARCAMLALRRARGRRRDPGVLRDRLRPRPPAALSAPAVRDPAVHRLGYPVPRRDLRSGGPHAMTLALFGIENDGVNLAVNLLVFFLVVIWLALVYWTYSDASRRLDDPMLVGCATAGVAVPVHRHDRLHDRAPARVPRGRATSASSRSRRPRSGSRCSRTAPAATAAREVEPSYLRCPSCMRKLKEPCRELRQAARSALEGLPVLRDRGRRAPAGGESRRQRRQGARTEAGKRSEARTARARTRALRRAPRSGSARRAGQRTAPGSRPARARRRSRRPTGKVPRRT